MGPEALQALERSLLILPSLAVRLELPVWNLTCRIEPSTLFEDAYSERFVDWHCSDGNVGSKRRQHVAVS